jgi:hypothetical protein
VFGEGGGSIVEEDVRVEDGRVDEDEGREEASGNRTTQPDTGARVPVPVREPDGRLDEDCCG